MEEKLQIDYAIAGKGQNIIDKIKCKLKHHRVIRTPSGKAIK
jgi:hypothetical protein